MADIADLSSAQEQVRRLELECDRMAERLEAAKGVIAEQAADLEHRRAECHDLEARMRESDIRIEAMRNLQLTRLEALDRARNDFINIVSHELRTPMTSILGYAELLEEELDLREERGMLRHVGQILAGTRRLERLVNDLLDYAQIEAGTFRLDLETANLITRIHDAVDSLLPLALDKALDVKLALPDGPVALVMDPGRIEQALFNLLGNAIKFTPARGCIWVSVVCDSDAAYVEVRDNGPGIAAEGSEALFEKFVQGEAGSARPRSGLGLGLSIARSIVEAHGGSIGMDSEPGVGSRFWFMLPLTAAPRTSLSPAEQARSLWPDVPEQLS